MGLSRGCSTAARDLPPVVDATWSKYPEVYQGAFLPEETMAFSRSGTVRTNDLPLVVEVGE